MWITNTALEYGPPGSSGPSLTLTISHRSQAVFQSGQLSTNNKPAIKSQVIIIFPREPPYAAKIHTGERKCRMKTWKCASACLSHHHFGRESLIPYPTGAWLSFAEMYKISFPCAAGHHVWFWSNVKVMQLAKHWLKY